MSAAEEIRDRAPAVLGYNPVTAPELLVAVLDELDAILEPRSVAGGTATITFGGIEWRAGFLAARLLVAVVAQEHGVIE